MTDPAVVSQAAEDSIGERSIALVVAMDENRLIGRDGDLPWRLPNDLKHFKRVTLGHTILMGRKTWDSLGRPLPQRENWVVSRDPVFSAPGASVFPGVDQALARHSKGELMVIGGAQLYTQVLPLARRIYLTRVHAALQGDTWFPSFDESAFETVACETHEADERHAYRYSFLTLERRR